MVRIRRLAGRPPLPEMRFGSHPRGQPSQDAVLVHGLPVLLQRQDRHCHAAVENTAPQMGNCHLSLSDKSEVGFVHVQRDIGVSQPTAWFMLHRIRQAWVGDGEGPFDGPVEFDETYVGGKRKNMLNAKRKAATGRGPVDICNATSPNSPTSTTSATQERLRRCGTRWPGLSGATFSTATSLRTTGFRRVPGRRGSVRRNSALASFSGVAPARSRAGSRIGFILASRWG